MSTVTGISSTGVGIITNGTKSKNKTGISSTGVKKSSTNKKKKKLNYNFKEISRMIIRAKTTGSARQAVTKAKVRVGELRKKLRTDEYDSKELESAIIHAEQMERIARKKVKHLQEEERAVRNSKACEGEMEDKRENKESESYISDMDIQYSDDGYCVKGQAKVQETVSDMKLEAQIQQMMLQEHIQEMRQLNREMAETVSKNFKDIMSGAMSDMKELNGLDELSEAFMSYSDDIDPADIEMLKKKHRSKEMKEITEADMKYLKAMFDRFQSEKQSMSGGMKFDMGVLDMSIATMTPVEEPVMVEGGSVDVML